MLPPFEQLTEREREIVQALSGDFVAQLTGLRRAIGLCYVILWLSGFIFGVWLCREGVF